MRVRLVEAIVRGELLPWAALGALWVVVAGVLLLQGRGRPTPARVLALFGLAGVTSVAGLVAAAAFAVPRVRWRAVDPGDLLGEAGATWRRLQGPAVPAIVGGQLDLAVPTADAQGRWILVGLLSGRPVDGLAAAPEVPRAPNRGPIADAGGNHGPLSHADLGTRVCDLEGASCRPWPTGWPSPERLRPFSQLTWSPEGAAGAIAYDVQTGRFLRDAAGGADSMALELTGDPSASASATSGAPFFELRRLAAGRLAAVRVVARRPDGPGPRYTLERAGVSLVAPRRAFYAVLPALVLGALGLPLVAVAYLVAPAWLIGRNVDLLVPADPVLFARTARAWLSRIAHPIAIALCGAAVAAPAIVALTSLLTAR